ncbi:multiple C2 and transmembrane domain-containing protein [Aphomia sociella]
MESENKNYEAPPSRCSIDSTDSSSNSSSVVLRKKNGSGSKKNSVSVLESIPSAEHLDTVSISSKFTADKIDTKNNKGTIVTIVLVEARDLPDTPRDDSTHGLFCKIRLGSKSLKSKLASNVRHPEWKERFDLHLQKEHVLRISLWDKGKVKNFMGSCILDLSSLEKDRTHEIWQKLDDGFGSVHFSVTMCNTGKSSYSSEVQKVDAIEKYSFINLTNDWKEIGQLHVKVIRARGLNGNPNAYCTLGLDNQMVQTHSVRVSTDASWDRDYVFNVYDITSTLELKVYDNSILNALRTESLGRVSIPLLRICNRTQHWYALKNKTKKSGAKGNCPRVLLDMSLYWNPLKATVRMFSPKEVNYLKKPPKFDVALVHSNMEFTRDIFVTLSVVNEHYKRLFEWDNLELSFVAMVVWILFWHFFQLWATPLLVLIPFIYNWICQRNQNEIHFKRSYNIVEDWSDRDASDSEKLDFKTVTGKIQGLPEMTLSITQSVEYMVCLAERLQNLAAFKVPFLSYLAMLFLIVAALILYLIPFNFIMISLAIYKFTRKYLNPERTPNNDLLDFISRIPDNEQLRQWKELSVPEPLQKSCNINQFPMTRSISY